MLKELTIENVAVIEKASITFDEGLTCLTGETGAGKSIVIDSINAILGDRLSKNIVRTGAKKASIVRVFEDLDEEVIKAARELDIDISDECIISRQITDEGKSTTRINSFPCPASVLKTIFADEVNIHGQHDNQSLLNPSRHLGILDSFGVDPIIKETYQGMYREYTELNGRIEELEQIEKSNSDNRDLLTYQVDEIEKAALSVTEEEELGERKKLIKNAENIINSLVEAHTCLFGDDDTEGALSLIQIAKSELEKIGDYAPEVRSRLERMNDSFETLQDASYDLKNYLDDFDVDISDLDYIEERLDVYYQLKRKYGPTVRDVLDYYEEKKAELEVIETARDTLDRLYAERKVLKDKLSISADRLTRDRKRVFDGMKKDIEASLSFLNMPFVTMDLRCDRKDFAANGQDDIEFLISANRGESPKPMARIASGGELSRIMLAMKNVLSEKEKTYTMIFDEIDTGVSGSAAFKIGQLMKKVSKGRQVLCVTHSPQIAAFRDNHMLIEKDTVNNATYTHIRRLNDTERIREIARIISGDNITATSLDNAREMLESAQETE
ncbi:MAG: DNA repair protein RecN [Oscillospiraceae bacterium]|nr:DNA repair protein RecN [Oscillospiraceae bacterium]